MKIRIALATFAGMAMAATVGVTVMAPAAGASTTPGTTTVARVAPAPPGPFTGQLSARLSFPTVRGNQVSYVLTLTNVSHSPVTVSGYPGLTLLDIFRHQLPTKTVQVKSFFFHRVVLFPGQSATSTISFVKFGRFFHESRFFGAKAWYLQVTLPSAPMPWSHHGFMPPVRFTLLFPGGPVRVVQNTLTVTALTGHMPIFHR